MPERLDLGFLTVKARVHDLATLSQVVNDAAREWGRQPWLRGHSDACWTLQPAIFRDMGDDTKSAFNREQWLTSSFKQRAPVRRTECPGEKDFFGWLAYMRHHGLWTRLLDWSESPLVALFFALKNRPQDATPSLWMLNPNMLNLIHCYDFRGKVPIELQRDSSGFSSKNAIRLAHPLTPDHELVHDLARWPFDASFTPEAELVAVLPQENNLMMMAQSATFTIHNSLAPMELHEHASKYLKHVLVDPQHATQLLIDLQSSGLTEYSLFPDLEHLVEKLHEEVTQWPIGD